MHNISWLTVGDIFTLRLCPRGGVLVVLLGGQSSLADYTTHYTLYSVQLLMYSGCLHCQRTKQRIWWYALATLRFTEVR